MKHGSTLFLKGVIVVIGVFVLSICIFALPYGLFTDKTGYYRPLILGLYITAVPFFIALYQALKLLGYIDKNEVFSALSVTPLKNIKYCATSIAALFTVGMHYIFYVGDRDDAPGVVALGLIIIFASIVIATAAALFQALLQNAVDLKAENDLTV